MFMCNPNNYNYSLISGDVRAGQSYTRSLRARTSKHSAINSEALLRYLRRMVNKTSKENLKPRKPELDEIKFLQCNMQKLQHAQIDLNRRLSIMNKDQERFIGCIQEPCSVKSKLTSQPNSVQRFGKSTCPRTCIYVDNQTDAWYMEALASKDITVIQIRIKKQDVLVVSAYMDSTDSAVWNEGLDAVVDYADDKNLALIMCIDSNCHSTLFGPDTNARGKKLEQAIARHNLHVENQGHVPTFHGGKARTCIDVTLTKRLSSEVVNWRVNTSYNGSDHNTIEFKVKQELISKPKVWLWHKADWNTFRTKMKSLTYKLPTNITNDTCEDMLDKFYKCLKRAMKKVIPRSKAKVVDRNNPWWTEQFNIDRRCLNKAYKAMTKHPTEANTNRYKRKHAKYKKKCNKARLWSWRDLQSNMGGISDMNMFRKIIQGLPK